jgi:hypoxanthine-DNA glycosylase
MPGEESLLRGEYYAHPRNTFWPIMGDLAGAGPELPYPERTETLKRAGIALWDVLRECRREGSLDGNIVRESEVPNSIPALLEKNPTIAAIAFNGRKSEAAFRKHIEPLLTAETGSRIIRISLPSTSPAHAGRTFEEKLLIWRRILTYLL